MWNALTRRTRMDGPGFAASLLLHLLLLFAVFAFAFHRVHPLSPRGESVVPVELVRFGIETGAPRSDRPHLPPQISAPRIPKQEAASPRDDATSPHGTKPLQDSLDAKLKALARLKQPRDRPLDGDAGLAAVTAGNGASYGVKDYVRAQVLRRWSLNLDRLGGRRPIVRLRFEMKRDGTVTGAEIVDDSPNDIVLHDIAVSARNAALLSSPIQLPPGEYPAVMRFTLDLNPRDAQH
jgi:outer membrane biosynthesis protein TonB